MSKRGDVFENPATGERAVVQVGTEETGGDLLIADVHVRPGGRVPAEHHHPKIEERFTVLHGRVGFTVSGVAYAGEPGVSVFVQPGEPHDWWNAGDDEAVIRVEVRPAARFEAMIRNLFGLAQDGRVNAKGMPGLLQLAAFAREFDDVIRFTRPPRPVQRVLFGMLAPVAWLRGYRGSYPEYETRQPGNTELVEWVELPT